MHCMLYCLFIFIYFHFINYVFFFASLFSVYDFFATATATACNTTRLLINCTTTIAWIKTTKKNRCNLRQSCNISVSDDTFTSDPCPGTFKYLEVQYRCMSPKIILGLFICLFIYLSYYKHVPIIFISKYKFPNGRKMFEIFTQY